MEGSSKPPQISHMFQKFALAFKTKTFQLFSEEIDDSDGFSLLDSAEEFITDQKVVVIKPDSSILPNEVNHKILMDPQFVQTLISSFFATVSSFKASYFQLQAAHDPFDEEGIKSADRTILSHLQKLSDLKKIHANLTESACFDLGIGSCMESQVQENQNRLRTLEIVFNRLQLEMDIKDSEALALRKTLGKVQRSIFELTRRLKGNNSSEFVLSVNVFDNVLRDTSRSVYKFTKLLIELMKRAGWDLDLAAKSAHQDIDCAKAGHSRYAFLSYVCLGMFQGFDSQWFGINSSSCKTSSLNELVDHVSVSPMEALSRDSDFSKFCEIKYQQIIHPTMESSIFRNLDRKEVVLCSWRSLSVFYEAFVNMASSIWGLHKLALSFDQEVEIFKVERGVEFSCIYMVDATRRHVFPEFSIGKARPMVGFTIVPGFKIGKTVIQSQVYLMDTK